MIVRLGNVLYWTATATAILLASLGTIGFVIAMINNAGEAMLLGPLLVFFAGLTWFAGRGCLYFLTGR